MEVDGEIPNVNDEEARKFLLSIDPLAALAQTQTQHPGLGRVLSVFGRNYLEGIPSNSFS